MDKVKRELNEKWIVWTKKSLDGWTHIKGMNQYEWVCTKGHIKEMKAYAWKSLWEMKWCEKKNIFLIIDFFLKKNIK